MSLPMTTSPRGWWAAMMKNVQANRLDRPSYFASCPERLQTEAHPVSFMVGNGEDIYSQIGPAIENAREEVVLITCFWARSTSLEIITTSLRALSGRIVKNKERPVRVFIGFSSSSALQKLFHTRSLGGRSYSTNEWKSKLWLPDPEELPGLDVQVKSIFVLPFSVMHPKFVLIDRKLAFLPSCNVSWESWFEGCITLSGPIIQQFVIFWTAFWLGQSVELDEVGNVGSREIRMTAPSLANETTMMSERGPAFSKIDFSSISSAYAIFLPSPHHAKPSYSFPWQTHAPPPTTPLNIFVLSAIEAARSSIYMQTPNITSAPVVQTLLQALRRGVNVHILTSEKLMILEQIVTAGTTTARCVKKLVKLYKRAAVNPAYNDEESRAVPIGSLHIQYFRPREGSNSHYGEPVQSHLKLTIIDRRWTILGSGNMDRASWYTSQELGVAFDSAGLAEEVFQTVERQMLGRTKLVFASGRE